MTTSPQKKTLVAPVLRKKSASVPVAKLAVAETATEWLGAYYVVDFDACNMIRLPNTKPDAGGWLKNAKANQKTNFDSDDKATQTQDFQDGTDDRADSSAPAKKLGIDSVTAAYIATHGVRSEDGKKFCFLIGGPDCRSIAASDMKTLGNGSLRYLFVATCESVAVADPQPVWLPNVDGLRAVFGYDGSIMDSADYGQNFFYEWQKGVGAKKKTTTQAFLDASWDVNHFQTPVAAWFGKTTAEAAKAQDGEKEFDESRLESTKKMSWRWYAAKSLPKPGVTLRSANMTLTLDAPAPLVDPLPMLAHFVTDPAELQHALVESRNGLSYSFMTAGGTEMVSDARSGSVDVTFPNFDAPSVFTSTPEDAIEKAQSYVDRLHTAFPNSHSIEPGLVLGLVPSELRRSYTATSESSAADPATVTHLTVVFRQTVDGVPTVGTGGVVEVTLNGALEVVRVRIVLRRIAAISPFPAPDQPTIDVARMMAMAEERALTQIEAPPGSRREIVQSEVGFFAAGESVQQRTSALSFRVVVKVSAEAPHAPFAGSFTRLFEKVYPGRELG